MCGRLLAVLTLMTGLALAAVAPATLRGRVVDSSGQPLAGVLLALQGTAGAAASFRSGSDGRFSVQVAAGEYTLVAHWQDHDVTVAHLQLRDGQTRDLQVNLGTAAAANAGSAQDLAARDVASMPLEQRDSSVLLLLAAGTTTASASSGNFTQQFSVHGQRGEAAVFALDGADTTDPELGGGTLSDFNVDAIASINSVSGILPAWIGEGAAGYTNVISKSGTAHWHGDVFEFLRNSAMDARNFFDRHSASNPGRLPPFRRNEFGGTLGGPLPLNLFVFVEYQGLRQALGTTQVLSVPTAAERRGEDTTAFPGDTLLVPVNPAVAGILARYPLPNAPLGPYGARTFAAASNVNTRSDQYSFRLDRKLSPRDQVFARYTVENVLGPTTNPGQTAIDPKFAQLFSEHYRSLALHYARVLTPTLTSDTIVGFLRSTPLYTSLDFTDPALKFADGTFQAFNSNSGAFRGTWSNVYQLRQNFAYQHGNHIFQFGGELREHRDTSVFTISVNGSYTFGGGLAYAPVAIPSASGQHDIAAGQPLPDTLSALLTATPYSFIQSVAEPGFPQGNRQGEAAIAHTAYNGYFQDTWRATQRLTLAYGLRYEVNTPLTEAHDMTSGPFFSGGKETWLLNPRPTWPTDWKGFGPRFSLDWQVAPATMLHAGAGIVSGLYYPTPDTGAFNDFPFSIQSVASAAPGAPVPFSATVPNVVPPPLYTPQGKLIYNGSSTVAPNTPVDVDRFELDMAAQFGGRVRPLQAYGQSQDFTNGYMATEVVGLEHRAGSLSLSASYIGVTGVHVIGNVFPNAYNGASPGFAPFSQFNASGQVIGGYGEEILFGNPTHSTYNAGEFGLTKAAGRAGLGFRTSFTYSHAIDNAASQGSPPQDLRKPGDERGSANTDVPLDLSFSLSERFPAALLPASFRWLAGLQVTGIGRLSSGTPFSVDSGVDQTGWGDNRNNRPDQIGIPALSTSRQRREDYFGKGAQNAGYFSIPIGIAGGEGPNQGRPGTLGRNTFRSPAYRDLDLAVSRAFALGPRSEGARLQLRAEAYNVLNNVNFNKPNNVLSGSGFGIITSTHGNARQMQLSAKLLF